VADTLVALAAELQRAGEAFALATVVRCEAPTSAKPGAKALVRGDGSVQGWVGGACAEPVVVREALEALRDGRPRLIGLYGEGGRIPGRTEGVLEYEMTCHSGGTLEIYVEPYLPKPLLVLVGHGPVVETLATLGRAADFMVVPLAPDAVQAGLEQQPLTERASVVVATHADSDEEVLDRVLRTDAVYVSLVASRRRAAVILDRLEQPAEGAGGARHRRGDARGDRGEHSRRDHPASPERQGPRRRGGASRGHRPDRIEGPDLWNDRRRCDREVPLGVLGTYGVFLLPPLQGDVRPGSGAVPPRVVALRRFALIPMGGAHLTS